MGLVGDKKEYGKQKGLGNKPSPNYYQAIVVKLLHRYLITRCNFNVIEESPYNPERLS